MRIEINKEDLLRIVEKYPGITTREIVERFYPDYAQSCYTFIPAQAKVLKYLTYFFKWGEMTKKEEYGKLRWYIEC